MKSLDGATALELLHRAVEEKGADYIDPLAEEIASTCLYVTESEDGYRPGCIVGHVFAYAGVPLDALDFEGDVWEASDHLWDLGVLSVTEEAQYVLAAAQSCQDRRGDWGTAEEKAREALDRWSTRDRGAPF